MGCVKDYMYSEGDRSSVILIDKDHHTCLCPFQFDNIRYIARIPVHRGSLRSPIVQVSGNNITCHPILGLRVYVAVTGITNSVTLCETLPFPETEQGLVVCSYRCPCYYGCHQVFVEAFNNDKSDNTTTNLQLCEILL